MRQQFIFALAVLLLMTLIPLVSLTEAKGQETGGAPVMQRQETAPAEAAKAQPARAQPSKDDGETVQVVRSASGQTETLAMREYLVGCVAAEMDAGNHPEALMAQAVASYTYARYRREIAGKDTLSDSGRSDQGYEGPAQRKQRWGENYELYEAKLEKAVDAVLGQSITYEGRPVFAAYSSLSGGKTESSGNYWGSDFAYLQSVDSPGDKLSPDYSRTVSFAPGEIEKALEKFDGLKLGKDPADWFGAPERSDAGTVMAIPVGNKTLTGRELREALELRSANFTIALNKDGAFEIKCLGYGHGVGMSQYGADFMARQGSGYREILEHYYTGCSVV
ncbi:MAG: stage II sporulation protein D [Oscillospiraceae bacterium]|nr:stage II sporulation protein D [Oscillospiraceae bacterium]